MESLDGATGTDREGFDTLGREDGAHRELAVHGNPTEGKYSAIFELRKMSALQGVMLCCPRSFSEVGLLVPLHPNTSFHQHLVAIPRDASAFDILLTLLGD